jgi:chromosome segregation ATPase
VNSMLSDRKGPVSLSINLSVYIRARANSESTLPLRDIIQLLNSLKVKSDDQQSAVSTIADLQKELANEQFARKDATKDAEVWTRVERELNEMVDQLLAQVTPLETQIEVLNSTVINASTELHMWSHNNMDCVS